MQINIWPSVTTTSCVIDWANMPFGEKEDALLSTNTAECAKSQSMLTVVEDK